LDEPFSALDSFLKWQMEMELADTLRRFGGTAVFVSHDRDEVYRLCDSVCILTTGKSEEKAGVRELFASPRTLSACLMTGCKNYSRMEKIDDTHVRALDWGFVLEVPAVPEKAAYVGVRAHDILHGDGQNAVTCTVERRVEDMFSDIVMLAAPGGGKIRMEAPKGEMGGCGYGAECRVCILPQKIMLLEA
jgi:molybdate transport system ATP-binding protein